MVEANIVQDYRVGNTRIKIADNYCCNKTEADVKLILQRIAQQAQSHINAAAAAGMYEQESEGVTTESMCRRNVCSRIDSNCYTST